VQSSGRALAKGGGGEKGKMSRLRDHMILVFYRKTAIHCGDHVRRHAAAELRRPELDRHFDRLKAVGGKQQGKRVDDDGGLDARVMGERLGGVLLPADLVADMARGLLA
jgi:hypothetical protein